MTPLVTLEEVRAVCGRKHVELRQEALTRLLVRAYAVEPKHWHYANAAALNSVALRKTFGRAVPVIMARYFVRVGNHLQGHWSGAYRLTPTAAQRVEQHLRQAETLDRQPFAPVARPVGKTGIRLPDMIEVSLAHLHEMLERVQAAILRHGPHVAPFGRLGSTRTTLETVYRQLVAVRKTVIEIGGLPNTYQLSKNGRWNGAHDHHVLRLSRPTRYLTLGPREALWDVDVSNAHLALAAGLVATWHPDVELPMLTRYLAHREEWLEELKNRLAEDVTRDDLKGVALAWLSGGARSSRYSTCPTLRAPGLPEAITALPAWNRLYAELRSIGSLLAPHSPLKRGSESKRLSRLLTVWETRVMQGLGLQLLRAGVNLQAWMYDGFLLVQGYENPSETLGASLGHIRDELRGEGYRFDSLGVKARSVDRLYQEFAGCLDPR